MRETAKNHTPAVRISINVPREWEDALTMVLYAHGAPGLEVEDPALIAAHLAAGDWDASVFDGRIIETGRLTLHALFPADLPLNSLYGDIAALSPQHASLFTISAAPLPQRDWQQTWRESFPTLYLGHRLAVTPYWRQESALPPATTLYINPGLAFGTGDHATTALAAQLLEQFLHPGWRVIDIGCGSGILAIAALKLGAAQALAVDNDPLCAASVAEHRTLNGLSEEELPFLLGDILQEHTTQRACREFAPQLLLSNIVAQVITALAGPAASMLAAGGLWICGGIWREKEEQVLTALQAHNWQIRERRERQGWLAFCCKQKVNERLFSQKDC